MPKNKTLNNKNTVLVVGYDRIATVSCYIGILLSAYAFHVEVAAVGDDNYQAMCDISEHMSCTKVFMSEYGKGFGIIGNIFGENFFMNVPNGFIGIFFYSFIGLLCLSKNLALAQVQLGVSILSVLTSIYLAYILLFILHDLCIVCVTTYAVNFVNAYCAYHKVLILQSSSSKHL